MTSNSNDYSILQEEMFLEDDLEVRSMNRTIVGTISLDVHRSLPYAGWISRLAIHPKFQFDQVAEPLIHRTMKFAAEIDMSSVETSTTECQSDLRELLLKMEFDLKQVYNREILGSSSFRIMKSQMGISLKRTQNSKNN